MITLLWGILTGIGTVLIGVVVNLVQAGSVEWAWWGVGWTFYFGALLGLAFGAMFALALGLLGRFFHSGRVPTWTAALIGGIGAPAGGALLLASFNGTHFGLGLVVAMAGLGLLIGGGIGAVSNRAALPPGTEPEQLSGTSS